jgi:hypothetical protein
MVRMQTMPTKTSQRQSAQPEQRAVQAQPALAGHKSGPLGNAGVLLSLQRSHGNRYVQRLLNDAVLQRSCGCGTCADCGKSAEAEAPDRAALQRKSSTTLPAFVQTKLTVSQPGDPYEQEADRVAEEVMRMPEGTQSACHAPLSIQRVQNGEGEEQADTRSVDDVISSAGQPLDSATRKFFEPRFGYDFSRVRVHADDGAAQSAKAVKARAYTVGEHVVFAAREFSPGSAEGRHLLAHELTHVVQQGAADSTLPSGEESEDSTLQKDDAPTLGAPVRISRKIMPRLSSGQILQRADCPCCVDSIAISKITKIDTTAQMGHSFDVDIGLSYPATGPSGSCTLEWWEKTDIPALPGHPANTSTNLFPMFPTNIAFAEWNSRDEKCASSSAPIALHDPPALGKRAGRTVTRTLEFKIVVNSAPQNSDSGCTAASKTVTAKQVLSMVSGAADWGASSFTTP